MILESLVPSLRSWAWQNRHPSQDGPWFDTSSSATGLIVTEITALSNTAVYQAVQLIAGMMATLPLITYRRGDSGSPERAHDHPLYPLLRYQPNPETTAYAFHESRHLNKLTGGNAYAEIVRDATGQPLELWQLPSWLVCPYRIYKRLGGGLTTTLTASTPEDRTRGGEIWYEVQVNAARPAWIPAENMLHTPGLSFNGLKGFSPIRVAMESIAVGLAIQKSAAAIFGNAAEPHGVIERPTDAPELTPAGEASLLAVFESRHRGVHKKGRIAVIQEGGRYRDVPTSARELQFAEAQKHAVPEVARIFNLSAYFLGHDGTQNTYSNVEGEWIRLARQTLMPHAEADQQEVYRKLVMEDEAGTVFAEYEMKALLKGDSKARAEYLTAMVEMGAMTTGEAARIENLPPVPEDQGGNTFRQPKAAAPAPAPPSNGDRAAGILRDRLESALRSSLQRVVNREVREIRREAQKPDQTVTAFGGWLDGFYQRELPDFASDLVEPPLGERRASELAWAYAGAHRAEIRRALESGDVAAVIGVIDNWTTGAAGELARAEIGRLTAA